MFWNCFYEMFKKYVYELSVGDGPGLVFSSLDLLSPEQALKL